MRAIPILLLGLALPLQDAHEPAVPLQPLALSVRRLAAALGYLGQPLPAADYAAIDEALALPRDADAVERIQQVLDRHVLLRVRINPESRVSVERGDAAPELIESGTRLFLVKVLNAGGVRAKLAVESPQSGRVSVPSWRSGGAAEPEMTLSPAQARELWADISLYDRSPLEEKLSGLAVEYRILQVYSRDAGQRAAQIAFNVGQGSQDIGFRNDVSVLFTARAAQDVVFRVADHDGRPGMAAFTIRDAQRRLYPSPSKRLAPDLPFQPQIYRGDGETVRLPEGRYEVSYTGGPEYRRGETTLEVKAGRPAGITVRLERWIDPASRGWYSADHHVHAAGCSHYENPTLGVDPADMFRQIRGEGLNIGSVLTWGPCYYHQKKFFRGSDDPLSSESRIMRYDLEVSGFPSSHAGHAVLLGLKEQDYPGTKRIEDWPSWILPVLRWAKGQGAVTGYAHTGWGLGVSGTEVPSFEVPPYDSIGANEFIVDVTHDGLVDFISAADTPYPWELSIWYHTLNVGFRTRISGETDFPCIFDDRVGRGRTYARMARLSFDGFLDALKRGASYVSDGYAHLVDFSVNGLAVGDRDSEIRVDGETSVTATVTVAAWLDETPRLVPRSPAKSAWQFERLSDDQLRDARPLRDRPVDEAPYWDVERARIRGTRRVPVELIVNGVAVATEEVEADGKPHAVTLGTRVTQSSWLAVRILPAAHTNPIFVIVDGKPIRASRESARWCLASVDQAWTQKRPQIRPAELADAERAWQHARDVYRRRLAETP